MRVKKQKKRRRQIIQVEDDETMEECNECGNLFHPDELFEGICLECRITMKEDPFYEEGIATDEDDYEAENCGKAF